MKRSNPTGMSGRSGLHTHPIRTMTMKWFKFRRINTSLWKRCAIMDGMNSFNGEHHDSDAQPGGQLARHRLGPAASDLQPTTAPRQLPDHFASPMNKGSRMRCPAPRSRITLRSAPRMRCPAPLARLIHVIVQGLCETLVRLDLKGPQSSATTVTTQEGPSAPAQLPVRPARTATLWRPALGALSNTVLSTLDAAADSIHPVTSPRTRLGSLAHWSESALPGPSSCM